LLVVGLAGASALAPMHRVLGAARSGIHIRGSAAHGVASCQHKAGPDQNDDRKLLDHDRSLCLTCETIMVLETADCPEAERA
jgi:hypothetical protein